MNSPLHSIFRFDVLAPFAGGMARSLASGISPGKALLLNSGLVRSASFRKALVNAAQTCDDGLSLSESLRPAAIFFPHFFIPLIAAGEISGRQAEAFRLVEQHCRRLKPALTAVRRAWLYPLACMLFGWTVRAGLLFGFGLYRQGFQFVGQTFFTGAVIVGLAWLLLQSRVVVSVLDYARLQLPVIREVEIRVSLALFFSTFRLMYSAGGMEVLTMFDLALATVRNSAIRAELQRARQVLEQNRGFEEAFDKPTLLEPRLSSLLASSAVAGRLDAGLDRVTTQLTEQLERALTVFNQLFLRVMAYLVAMSIVGTLLFCINSWQHR